MIVSRRPVVCVLALCVLPGVAPAQIVKPLSPLNASATATGQSLDASGNVAGFTTQSNVDTPVLWRPTGAGGSYVLNPLPLLSGTTSGAANSIGPAGAGRIVGYTQPSDVSTAIATLWTNGGGGSYTAGALPTPSDSALTNAYAVNSVGVVAGYKTSPADVTRAVAWTPGLLSGTYNPVVLPQVVANQMETAGTAVNSQGNVAGYLIRPFSTSQPELVGVVWESTGLGTYAAKEVISTDTFLATGINDAGIGSGVYAGDQAGVMALFEGDYYAFELDVPFGSSDSASNAVNSSDGIVGYLKDPTTAQAGDEAALWRPTDNFWELVNLDQWLDQASPTVGSQWVLQEATGISDNWLVTGIGLFDHDGLAGTPTVQRGFVLDVSSLVPEPAALSLAGVLVIPLLQRRRRIVA